MDKSNKVDRQIDPRDWFFGAMLKTNHEQQFEYFHVIKPQWFTIRHHKDLYDCLKHCVENGVDFNLLTAVKWFTDQTRFSTAFTPVQLSELTHRVGYPDEETIISCIHQTAYKYFFEASFHFHNRIGQTINSPSFDMDKLRDEIDSFQKQIDADYIEESEQTNTDIVNEVVKNHDLARAGNAPGIWIGFKSLKHVILEPVDFMVIGARPSMGKTAFIVSAAYNLAFIHKKNIALFSLEMSKTQMIRRFISLHTGIPDKHIKLGNCTSKELEQIELFKAMPDLNRITIYEGSHKSTDIIRKTSLLNKKKTVDLVIVDYLQKITPERNNMKMIEHVSNASNQMKNLSMNLQIPTVALAQLSRSVEQRGGDKRPVLSDLRESGEIEQDASIVGFLHRPEYYGFTTDEKTGESNIGVGEFILAKNRGDEIGLTKMNFDGPTMKWSDVQTESVTHGLSANTSFENEQQNIFEKKDEMPF